MSRYLRRIRVTAWCAMVIERLWPLCLPLILTGALFAALAWLNVFSVLPYAAHGILLAVFALAGVICLLFLSLFRFPTLYEVDRRIEAASKLAFQPLLTQQDRPAGAVSPLGQRLWREHQRHMAEKLSNLHVDMPHPDIPHRDVHALRAVVFLLFAVSFAASFGQDAGRLSDAFYFSKSADASPVRIDAWVTPPRYTGRPPVYLSHQSDTVDVQQNSLVTVRITNSASWRTKLVVRDKSGRTVLAPRMDNGAPVYETKLSSSATVTLSAAHLDKSWSFHVSPNRPPSIEWTKPPQRAMNGTLELDYKIEDDYGATKSWAETIRPANSPVIQGHPLYMAPEIALALPRGGKGRGHTLKDLTGHPWAGSDVEMRLVVEDGAGQQAKSPPMRLTLPQRSFGNPLARAIIEQRRLLAQDAFQRERVSEMLAALLIRPEDTIPNSGQALALYSLRTRLSLAGKDDALRGVVNYMWDIANGIESGERSGAEQRLKQAQQALRDALRNGASQEEIGRLMDELRHTMENYISMLAQQNKKNATGAIPDGAQLLGADELEKRLKELEEMARLGNMGAAEQLLAELENMMNQLQVMPGNGTGQAKSDSPQGRMQKQMDALSNMMRRQQKMLDETHRLEDQRQRDDINEDELRRQLNRMQQNQGQLQSELKGLEQQLGQEGLKPGAGFSEAENSMDNAQDAMREGNGSQAQQNQADALDAMRRGAQDLMGQMREVMKKSGENSAGNTANRDPLGRAQQNSGQALGENGTHIPGEMDIQRARRILDEIRRRLGALTPQIEKDYLERLLKFE